MAEPTVQLLLRVSPELKKQIEDAAKQNQRSINFEAIQRLEKSFLSDQRRRAFSDIYPNDLPEDVLSSMIEVIELTKDIIDKRD